MALIIAISRLAGWLMLIIIAVYILTGFSYTGFLGFDRVIDHATAQVVHSNIALALALAGLALIHCCLRVFIRLKRKAGKGAPSGPPARGKASPGPAAKGTVR